MKKMFIILALVAVASAPAMAAVTVTCSQAGATVTVGYTVTSTVTPSDPNRVRAFALDATVSTGTISNAVCSNASYYVYPGSIAIVSGSVSSPGSCVCSSTYPGTKGGVTTSGVTVEMGSLYTGTNKPATSGTLFTLTISNTAATVTLSANTARGGVVMENPAENPSLTIDTCAIAPSECFPSSYVGYADWKTMGKPNCWCGTNTAGMSGTPTAWRFQCYGDADNKTQDAVGKYRVYSNDYWKLVSNWKKKITDPTLDACADFDHKSQDAVGKYRVYSNDYWKMVSNWKKRDSQFTGTGNCPTG